MSIYRRQEYKELPPKSFSADLEGHMYREKHYKIDWGEHVSKRQRNDEFANGMMLGLMFAFVMIMACLLAADHANLAKEWCEKHKDNIAEQKKWHAECQ